MSALWEENEYPLVNIGKIRYLSKKNKNRLDDVLKYNPISYGRE